MICYIIGTLISIYFLIKYQRRRQYRIPSGPPKIPFVGSLPFLHGEGISDKLCHKSLEKYGKDFCAIWAPNLNIIIQDFDLAKDLLSRDEFSDRAPVPSGEVRGYENKLLGIFATSGSMWREQRRFTLKHLRDFGFGKQSLDIVIQDEANDTIEKIIETSLSNRVKYNVKIDGLFNIPAVNVIWRIIANKRFDPDSEETKMFMERITKFFRLGPHPLLFIPYIWYIRPYVESEKNTLAMKEIFRRHIREHEEEYNESDEPRDFIDVFLRQIKIEKKEKGSNYSMENSNFHFEQLTTICLDFFEAGSETTSTTLTWAVMYMALYPTVQEKCQLEIDENIQGNNSQLLFSWCFKFYVTSSIYQNILTYRSTTYKDGYANPGVLLCNNPRDTKNIRRCINNATTSFDERHDCEWVSFP